jgi:hypothetical protein
MSSGSRRAPRAGALALLAYRQNHRRLVRDCDLVRHCYGIPTAERQLMPRFARLRCVSSCRQSGDERTYCRFRRNVVRDPRRHRACFRGLFPILLGCHIRVPVLVPFRMRSLLNLRLAPFNRHVIKAATDEATPSTALVRSKIMARAIRQPPSHRRENMELLSDVGEHHNSYASHSGEQVKPHCPHSPRPAHSRRGIPDD